MQNVSSRTVLLPLALTLATAAPSWAIDQARCDALSGAIFDAGTFEIASGAATVDRAEMRAPAAETTNERGARVPATPAYCQLNGRIAPVGDAPDIAFQINLPAEWNSKVVQYGGGGFNGVLTTGLDPLRDARPDTPAPLMQGYVTAGTDSGHVARDLPEMQAFATNPEALENFAHASYKKLHDLTVAVAARAYDRAPARYYYFGGSEGGREGLTMAQRYPQDFDGIYSSVPVINWVGLQSRGTQNGQLQRQDGGWLTPDAAAVLARAAIEQCDMLDGLADGVIGNTEACRATFSLDAYICTENADPAGCLTPKQAEVATIIRAPMEYGITLANGLSSYPGFPIGGEIQENGFQRWTSGNTPPTLPGNEDQSRTWYYGNGAIRYFIAQDAGYDPDGYRMADMAEGAARISALMDSTDPDLSAYAARGGKLILQENMADYAQSPYAGIAYYDSVVALMGQDKADEFLRFYLKAGANHSGRVFGAQGNPLPSHVDILEQLDGWVESGTPPHPVLTLSAHQPEAPYAETATRPMCSYPDYPHLTGDKADDAASFECRAAAQE